MILDFFMKMLFGLGIALGYFLIVCFFLSALGATLNVFGIIDVK